MGGTLDREELRAFVWALKVELTNRRRAATWAASVAGRAGALGEYADALVEVGNVLSLLQVELMRLEDHSLDVGKWNRIVLELEVRKRMALGLKFKAQPAFAAAMWFKTLSAGFPLEALRDTVGISPSPSERGIYSEALLRAFESIRWNKVPPNCIPYLRTVVTREAGKLRAEYGTDTELGACDLDELEASSRAAGRLEKSPKRYERVELGQELLSVDSDPESQGALLLALLKTEAKNDRERRLLDLYAQSCAKTDAARLAGLSPGEARAFTDRLRRRFRSKA